MTHPDPTLSVAPAPDFFLVGAPKSATSSLHLILREHPDIFMCSPKEPLFFCTDLPGLAEVTDRAAYDALFAEAPEGALKGEASAFYLMSETAAENIYAANPAAKIILSLRNPVEAARSLYHQLRDGFREDQTSFEAAWALQEARARGEHLPPYCPEPKQLQYAQVYSYADQVARYLERFGPDQVLILWFEEIKRDPDAVVARVIDFLGLPPFEAPAALPETNTRRAPRFPGLTQFLTAPPPLLRPLVAPVKRLMNAVGLKPSVIMMRYLSRPADNAPAPPRDTGFQARLTESFAADLERLEARLGADLSPWRGEVSER